MNDFVLSNRQQAFVTTAIDYPNARPHIGTAFEKIGADVYARFRRFQGKDVYFLMGNDENTVKVVKKAQQLGVPVKQYVDDMAEQFKRVWELLNLSYDDFIQTTEERHKVGVQHFLSAVQAAGYIEKRPYQGWYCEGCEEFKLDKNLTDTNGSKACPNHLGTPLVWKEEENYFFLLSKFRQRILDLIYPTPFVTAFLSVEPECRYNEVKNIVETELHDISISRRNEGWGIPIPWDSSQVTYVWFDALLNYLTGIGFGTDWEKFNKYWPAEVHFIGKDITRFHCALFPAMCMAYNEGCADEVRLKAYPQRVFAHGFIHQRKGDEWVKESKSGESIDPELLVRSYGSDAYRYYFLSKCSYADDGEYSLDHFKETYNADLANNLGNLVSRVYSMIQQYHEGVIPPVQDDPTIQSKVLCGKNWLGPEFPDFYGNKIVECNYRAVLVSIWDAIAKCNLYIENSKPWNLGKTDKRECAKVLVMLVAGIRQIAVALKPFLPTTAAKIYSRFKFPVEWSDVQWSQFVEWCEAPYKGLEGGVSINTAFLEEGRCKPLFPRLDK